MISNEKHRRKLKRYNIPNHARELTFSCYRRYPYFDDPIACMIFLDLLGTARIEYGFELWAYVIMPDHVHLLIWPEERGYIVSEMLHSVKGKTGRQYKDHLVSNMPDKMDAFFIEQRGKKKFKFWQSGGGYDRNLWNSKPIHNAIKYIEFNSVRSGLVSNSYEWKWSSAWARKNKCGLVPDDFNIPMLMQS